MSVIFPRFWKIRERQEMVLTVPGFAVGFGVSLLGAIMLFIGATGAFASTSLTLISSNAISVFSSH